MFIGLLKLNKCIYKYKTEDADGDHYQTTQILNRKINFECLKTSECIDVDIMLFL
jgi:hypothetical protein